MRPGGRRAVLQKAHPTGRASVAPVRRPADLESLMPMERPIASARLYLAAAVTFLFCALVEARHILTADHTRRDVAMVVLWAALGVAFLAFSRRR